MISIICGTNRGQSVSKKIALYYQNLLKEAGANSYVLDLKELPEDFMNVALYDNAGKSEAFNTLKKKLNESHKMVFIVPEYNGSFKKCALLSLSSGSQGGALALSHLTDILHYCGMNVLAQKPKLAKIEANFKEGQFTNELYVTLLKEQIEAFLPF
jgi:chromate reductase